MQKAKMRTPAGEGALWQSWNLTGYLTGGCVYLTKGSSTGDACKYGAKIMACLRRYRVKSLPAQCPCDWMTSKGTPCSRYSNFPPIQRLWPLRFRRLNRFVSLLILLVNSFLLRGPTCHWSAPRRTSVRLG